MLGCHYSNPAKTQIAAQVKEGKTDDEIVAAFVKKEGKQALAVPPTEGFSLTAWLAPPFVGLAGVGFIAWFIRRSRGKSEAPALDEGDMEKYQNAAERDLSRFDE